MSTHAVRHHTVRSGMRVGVSPHWAWLAGGFALAFAVPFLLAETRSAFGVVFEINRDLYYGVYALAVAALFALWSRSTGYDVVAAVRRRWVPALVLGLAAAGILAVMVVRTDDATTRPDGIELVGAVIWRGIVYGVADGLLLSVFPILAVFAAFAGSRLNRRFAGKVVIGIVALVASLAMTAVYHVGYSDFRSEKVAKPLTGDMVWSVPTLVTLNPIGAPIAHAGLHTAAVLHSYETEIFLPPHQTDDPR